MGTMTVRTVAMGTVAMGTVAMGTVAMGAMVMAGWRRGVRMGLLGIVGALVLAGCASEQTGPTEQPSFYNSMAQPGAKVDAAAAASMISGYRANNGLGAVEVDPLLMKAAEEQAAAMVRRDKLDHNAGKTFTQRLKASGFPAATGVENISAGYHTLAEAFSGWRDSPPHKANMLHKDVTKIGIAAVHAPKSKYKVFWALILAAPERR
jgi:uncharacterized protein YkwD